MFRLNRNRKEELNRRNGGFSLIEVVIAMVVLAIISIPLLNYFMDSMRYSAVMARKQKATLLAQEVTEAMKAEKKLIQYDTGIYQAPVLTAAAPDGYGLTMSGSGAAFNDFKMKGQGTALFSGAYSGTNGNFDIQVTLKTDTPSSDPTSPAVYGVDNTRDVLAVESDQLDAALMFFRTANNDYCNHTAGATPLTADEVREHMDRVIHVDVDHDASDNKITVKVYYTVTCSGVPGVDSSSEFTSTYLANVRLDELKNIYVIYSCNPAVAGSSTDNVLLDLSSAAQTKLPLYLEESTDSHQVRMGLYLIGDVDHLPAGTMYTVNANGTGAAPSTYMVSVHSNVTAPNQVNNNIGTVKKSLTGSVTPVRLVSIVTEIFESGHGSGEEALATVTTTKGEQP